MKKVLVYAISFAGLLHPLDCKAVSMPFHSHGNEWTSWEADSVGTYNLHPNNPSLGGGDPEAGDTKHQHYTATPLINTNQAFNPFSVVGAWVNRVNYDFPEAQYPIVPHGFIDESNVDNIPRFRFVGDNWKIDANAMKAQPLVLKAFSIYSSLQAGASPVTHKTLITGLEFMPVESNEIAEIDIFWGGTKSLGENIYRVNTTTGIVSDRDIFFNSDDIWSFGLAADTPLDKYHFFSTAIHEIGHAVGLYEQEDPDDVMIFKRGKGPSKYNPDGTLDLTYGPAFDALDVDSTEGALALYSIPAVPGPIPFMGLAVFFRYSRKLRGLNCKLHKKNTYTPVSGQA